MAEWLRDWTNAEIRAWCDRNPAKGAALKQSIKRVLDENERLKREVTAAIQREFGVEPPRLDAPPDVRPPDLGPPIKPVKAFPKIEQPAMGDFEARARCDQCDYLTPESQLRTVDLGNSVAWLCETCRFRTNLKVEPTR